MNERRPVCGFLSFIMIVLLAVGCSSSDPAPPVYLDGYVSADGDVAGARVQVTDMSGNVRAEKAPATSSSGAFMITVNGLPRQFRVVSSGGTIADRPADYRLTTQIERFNPGTDRVYVNLVTTLVCAYLDRNPGKSLADAVREVKAFLAIPAEVDIAAGLYHSTKYFSALTFLQEAETNGGVEAFLGTLAQQLTLDPAARHPFPSRLLGGPGGGALTACPGTTLGQAARNGVIAWGVGLALNIGMSELFGMGGPSKEDIEELKQMLSQIQAQLVELKNEVLSLKLGLYQLEYNLGTMLLSDYVTLVENAYTGLSIELLKDPATLTPNEIAQRNNTINYWMKITGEQIKPLLGALHTKLYGTLGSDGLYKAYARKLKEEKRFISYDNYHGRVKKVLLYYNQIEAAAVYLSTEYSRKENMSLDDINKTIQQLDANSQLEMAWYNSVQEIWYGPYVIDRDLKLMMQTGWEWDRSTPYEGTWVGADHYVFVTNKNIELYGGYGPPTWRVVSSNEVNDFLKDNRSNKPYYQYLIDQGWPAPEYGLPNPYYFGTAGGWIYSALDMTATSGGWTQINDPWPGLFDAYWIFVRPLTADENYFW